MKRLNRAVAVVSLLLSLASPTLARGDSPPIKEKHLSFEGFKNAFHSASVEYSDGNLKFFGTTSQACMDLFSFSRSEASTEVSIRFRYTQDSQKSCLDSKAIQCDDDHVCVGLRSKDDSTVKLGDGSGEVQVVFKQANNVDSYAGEKVKDSKGKSIYHKGAIEIAKEQAEADEKERAEKIKANQKLLKVCANCTYDEQGIAKKRDAIEDMLKIGEFTDEQAEKEKQRIDLLEMKSLTAQLDKARNRRVEEDSLSEVETIKERVAALAAGGDEKLNNMAIDAYLKIMIRKMKDGTVDPIEANENAIAMLDELDGFELSEQQLGYSNQFRKLLNTRQGCLTGQNNSAGCQSVFQEIAKERQINVPSFAANGNQNQNPNGQVPANPQQPWAQAAQGVANIPGTLANEEQIRRQINQNTLNFPQLSVPTGNTPFIPAAQQYNQFGLLNSAYQLNTNPLSQPQTFGPQTASNQPFVSQQ